MRTTWNERFAKYVEKRFGGNLLEASFSLHVSPSRVHDWVNGTTPREETRDRIEKWSDGDVPAKTGATRPLAKSSAPARRKAAAS